jgi:hypothetical protein
MYEYLDCVVPTTDRKFEEMRIEKLEKVFCTFNQIEMPRMILSKVFIDCFLKDIGKPDVLIDSLANRSGKVQAARMGPRANPMMLSLGRITVLTLGAG